MTCFDGCCNKKLHLLIISVIIALSTTHYIITQLEFEGIELFINFTLMGSISVTLIALGIIYKRYIGARNIRIAFLFLFLSYIAYLSGEVIWFVYETILEIYPYPSLADVGFFFYFVLSTIFLISTIRCYNILTRYDIGAAVLIMSVISSIYLVVSIEADTFDIVFGIPFILAASSMFAFSAIALHKLKGSSIRLAWTIIFISMLITTVADIWYYILENVYGYTYDHIVNTLWIISDAVLVYALIIHKRVM